MLTDWLDANNMNHLFGPFICLDSFQGPQVILYSGTNKISLVTLCQMVPNNLIFRDQDKYRNKYSFPWPRIVLIVVQSQQNQENRLFKQRKKQYNNNNNNNNNNDNKNKIQMCFTTQEMNRKASSETHFSFPLACVMSTRARTMHMTRSDALANNTH